MIKTFADKRTAALFADQAPKGIPADLRRRALIKLLMIDSAAELHDLRSPPGNRLEALKDDRAGQHSIRVNDQWRICFTWTDGGVLDVEFCDYH